MTTGENRGYRSIFWPILLIGAGTLWLLANLDIIPGWNWWSLWRLWPLFLIAGGLDMLFARRSPVLGALLGLLTVAAAVLLLVAAPSLGLAPSRELVSETFSEPLGEAASADVEIDLAVADSTISALTGGQNLIEAEIVHFGDVGFSVSGSANKDVRLYQVGQIGSFNIDWPESSQLHWDIGLSGAVPLSLTIDGGVGEADVDLSRLRIRELELNIDVGDVVLILPAQEESYVVSVDGGVGRLEIRIEPGASLALDVNGDVGDIVIDVPDRSAVRMEAETDIGDIRVPASFTRTRGGGEQFVGESGTWETPGFEDASEAITIVFDGGVGNLTVR